MKTLSLQSDKWKILWNKIISQIFSCCSFLFALSLFSVQPPWYSCPLLGLSCRDILWIGHATVMPWMSFRPVFKSQPVFPVLPFSELFEMGMRLGQNFPAIYLTLWLIWIHSFTLGWVWRAANENISNFLKKFKILKKLLPHFVYRPPFC